MAKQKGVQKDFAQNAKTLMLDWIGTRTQITFLLDLSVARDCEAYEIIQWMKKKRVFLPNVILGLRIVWEAGQGKYDTLLMSFPDVIEKLRIKISPPPPPPDTKALEDRIEQLQDSIELMIANQKQNTGYTMASQPAPTLQPLQSATGGLKTIGNAKPLAAPTFDDDDDLPMLVTKKNTSNDSVKNFLAAMSGIH